MTGLVAGTALAAAFLGPEGESGAARTSSVVAPLAAGADDPECAS